MYLSRLDLRDFRSWELFDHLLDPGILLLVGPNGQGKTNIVEAVFYLSTLSSHRVSSDHPLIRFHQPHARIAVDAHNGNRTLSPALLLQAQGSNRALINRTEVPRTRDILGIVKAVLFAPEDLVLVRGEPGDRRRFVDDLLATRHPRVAALRAEYDKIHRQRTALLKTAGGHLRRGYRDADGAAALATLDSWDEQLARFGSALIVERYEMLAALMPHVQAAYRGLAPQSREIALSYASSLAEFLPALADTPVPGWAREHAGVIEAALLNQLAAVRPREIERGTVLAGPNRDDVVIKLGEQPAKGFASHGESWSVALALRLGSFYLLRSDGTDPILLLDDVFAELDARRRERLMSLVADAEQVIITAAVEEDLPQMPAGVQLRRMEIRQETRDDGAVVSIVTGDSRTGEGSDE